MMAGLVTIPGAGPYQVARNDKLLLKNHAVLWETMFISLVTEQDDMAESLRNHTWCN